MGESVIREKIYEEIDLIPEYKLPEIYELIHYFRVGLQNSRADVNQIMKFAGCWKDMPENVFSEFLEEIAERRKQAFSRRQAHEASIS